MSLKNLKVTDLSPFIVVLLLMGGCAVSGGPGHTVLEDQSTVPPVGEPALTETEAEDMTWDSLMPQEQEGAEEHERPSPRVLASLRLTDQGRELIEAGRPDDAIRILERAINLDSNNGRNYYYLAEAWIMKGVLRQASEFNNLAGQYLKGDPVWEEKVIKQRRRIVDKTL